MRGRLVAALCLSPDVLHGLLRPTPMATRRTDRPTDFLILSFLFVALSVPCQDQVLHALGLGAWRIFLTQLQIC